MVMMLMFLDHFREIIRTDGLTDRFDLTRRPFKYFLGLYAGVGIFHIFLILHHLFNIIVHPGLVIAQVGARAHITE